MSSCFVNYCPGGNLFLLQLHSLPPLLPASFIDHLETPTANWACILLSLNSFKWPSVQQVSRSLIGQFSKQGTLIGQGFVYFFADVGCIVRWTFISGGWETNLVSWSLSSICNIFWNKRPWIVYYPALGHWPHPRGLWCYPRCFRSILFPPIMCYLMVGREGRWCCTVHSTLYSGHGTLVLCVDTDCDASPSSLLSDSDVSYTPTLTELRVTDCCLYFAYQAQPSPSQQWCSLQIFVSAYS